MSYHKSVLLEESIEALRIRPGGTYVDATFGGGGHSRAILARLEGGRLIAFDQDPEAVENRPDDPRLTIVNHNFRFLRNFLRLHQAMQVDGILADLGVSSHQIDEPGRGFSTRFDGELDMRMDRRKPLTAVQILNKSTEEALAGIFHRYGEIANARKLASRIVEQRKTRPFQTTTDLKEVADRCAERGREFKYEAQVFQALRIEVNNELPALTEFLEQSVAVLSPGGRLVVISYHSLEDRLVKNFFRSGNFEGIQEKDFFGNVTAPLKMVTRRVVVPGAEEIENNNRARSARLRVAEKTGQVK